MGSSGGQGTLSEGGGFGGSNGHWSTFLGRHASGGGLSTGRSEKKNARGFAGKETERFRFCLPAKRRTDSFSKKPPFSECRKKKDRENLGFFSRQLEEKYLGLGFFCDHPVYPKDM